jgi:hypothetical protein
MFVNSVCPLRLPFIFFKVVRRAPHFFRGVVKESTTMILCIGIFVCCNGNGEPLVGEPLVVRERFNGRLGQASSRGGSGSVVPLLSCTSLCKQRRPSPLILSFTLSIAFEYPLLLLLSLSLPREERPGMTLGRMEPYVRARSRSTL